MATSYKETAKLGHNFKIDGKGPIDVRFVVKDKSSLTDGTFTYENSYNMLIVGVETDKSIYVLTNASAPTQPNSWLKLASAADVSSLSGVFKFKGTAFAVSPDNSYILLNNDDVDAVPLGTECDTIGNTYFGWNIGGQEVWTAGTFWENAVLYTKSDTSTPVYGLTINDTLYFVSDSQPKPTEGTLLESLDGRCVWLDSGLGNIENLFTDVNPVSVYVCNKEGELTDDYVNGYIFAYDSYTFTERELKVVVSFYVTPLLASDGTRTDGDGNTIPDNSGHVYQIGENEYASNGQIWVKLGAPTEDWIVL